MVPTKILLVIGSPLTYGGHIKSALSFAKYLNRNEHCRVAVLSPDGPYKSQFTEEGVPVYVCDQIAQKFPSNLYSLPRFFLTRRSFQYDIIHAQDPQALRPAYVASRILPVAFVYTEAGGPGARIYLPGDCPIVIYSKELESYFAQFQYLTGNLNLIGQRIDLGKSPPSAYQRPLGGPQRDSRPGDEKFTIFMAMRFESQKESWLANIFTSIKGILRADKSIVFTIAGDGRRLDHYKDIGEELNQELDRKAVNFAGAIFDDGAMAMQYHHSDLVAGHGRGVMEAMACGKPVIVLGKAGKATLVTEENVELVSHYNFSGRHIDAHPATGEDIESLVSRCHKNRAFSESLGRNNHVFIKSHYDAEEGARLLARLYRTMPLSGYHRKLSPFFHWSYREFLLRRMAPL